MTEICKQNAKKCAFYTKVFKIVGNYWQQGLMINDDKAASTKYLKSQMKEGNIDNHGDPDWEKNDMMMKVKMAPTDGGTLAWAGPLYRHPVSQRPITGETAVTEYGDKNFEQSADPTNSAVATLIHEVEHAMHFIELKEMHPHYVQYSKEANTYLWTGPTALKNAHKYYGCDEKVAIKGIPLQVMKQPTEKEEGEVGAHWQEAYFDDELMTPFSGKEPEMMSPMTLGAAEDTKWYKASYRFIEPYKTNKGYSDKCKNLRSCPKTQICKPGTSDFVTSDYQGVGYCDKDDNQCDVEVKYENRDVHRPSLWGNEYLQYGAAYGRSSIVQQGLFYKWEKDAESYDTVENVSVEANCNHDHNAYTLEFNEFEYHPETSTHHGDIRVTCTKKDEVVKFNCKTDDEYCSEVKCYDPKQMCENRFKSNGGAPNEGNACHISCMKNGRCHTGEKWDTSDANGRRLELTHDSEEVLNYYNQSPHVQRSRRLLTRRHLLVKHAMKEGYRGTRRQPDHKMKKNQKAVFSKQMAIDMGVKSKQMCGKISKDKKCGPKFGRCQGPTSGNHEIWCHNQKCQSFRQILKEKMKSFYAQNKKMIKNKLNVFKAIKKSKSYKWMKSAGKHWRSWFHHKSNKKALIKKSAKKHAAKPVKKHHSRWSFWGRRRLMKSKSGKRRSAWGQMFNWKHMVTSGKKLYRRMKRKARKNILKMLQNDVTNSGYKAMGVCNKLVHFQKKFGKDYLATVEKEAAKREVSPVHAAKVAKKLESTAKPAPKSDMKTVWTTTDRKEDEPNTYQCWCYDDYQEHKTCGNLEVDQQIFEMRKQAKQEAAEKVQEEQDKKDDEAAKKNGEQ